MLTAFISLSTHNNKPNRNTFRRAKDPLLFHNDNSEWFVAAVCFQPTENQMSNNPIAEECMHSTQHTHKIHEYEKQQAVLSLPLHTCISIVGTNQAIRNARHTAFRLHCIVHSLTNVSTHFPTNKIVQLDSWWKTHRSISNVSSSYTVDLWCSTFFFSSANPVPISKCVTVGSVFRMCFCNCFVKIVSCLH